MPTPDIPRVRKRLPKRRRKPGLGCECAPCERRWRRAGGESETDSDASSEYDSDGDDDRGRATRSTPLSPKRARILRSAAAACGLSVNAVGEAFDADRPQQRVSLSLPSSLFARRDGATAAGAAAASAGAGWAVPPAGSLRRGGAKELVAAAAPRYNLSSAAPRLEAERDADAPEQDRRSTKRDPGTKRSAERTRSLEARLARDLHEFIARRRSTLFREFRRCLRRAVRALRQGASAATVWSVLEDIAVGHPGLMATISPYLSRLDGSS